MFISVLILNYNYPNDTLECITSLMKTDYKNFEVILIDNGSGDDSVDILSKLLKHYKNLIFIQNKKNLGFTGGNNVGIMQAKGDYILLLNNDTVVEENFISILANKAKEYPDAAAIGPKIYYYDDPARIWFAGGTLGWLNGGVHIGLNEIDEGQYDIDRHVAYITGCALLMKKRIIDEIGLLDDKFFMYYEDMDWCLRAKKKGYQSVYVSKPVLWHKVSRTIMNHGKKITDRQLYLLTRNRILVSQKNCSTQKYVIFLIKLVIYTPPYVIYLFSKRDFVLLKAYLRGLYHGLSRKDTPF